MITVYAFNGRTFLKAILPFRASKNMVRKGIIYLFVANIYAYRLAFFSILNAVLLHFTLHFAAKRTAFSTKTHCV